jgi:putative Holliday junction resolvase
LGHRDSDDRRASAAGRGNCRRHSRRVAEPKRILEPERRAVSQSSSGVADPARCALTEPSTSVAEPKRRALPGGIPVSRLLGIDLGSRRIGLALADPDGRAFPLATIGRGRGVDEDVARLARIAAREGVAELIVGLPLDASGAAGSQANVTRDWAAAVAERLDLPLTLRDERLSSFVAETRLGPMRRGRSGGAPTRSQRVAYRSRVDREAAAIILQDELDARQGGAAS